MLNYQRVTPKGWSRVTSCHFSSMFCFWPQSYVTTRFKLCFSAWQCAFMCIFLHACHADWRVGSTRFMLCFSAWQCAFMCNFLHACHADWRVGWGRGSGWGGWGGCLIAFCRLLPVASSFRHAHDATLYRSSLAILDTLMMGGVGGGFGLGGGWRGAW